MIFHFQLWLYEQTTRYDGFTRGYLSGDQTSNRALQGSTCKVLLAQKATLGILMEKVGEYEWPETVKTAIRENSMDHETIRRILVSTLLTESENIMFYHSHAVNNKHDLAGLIVQLTKHGELGGPNQQSATGNL